MLIDDSLLLLGIRHHGPGSSASMLRALEAFEPDVLLVEGAPECEGLLGYMQDEQLKPPVAQLIYAEDDHRDSVFYPFTEFSPEWQASMYAGANDIEVKYIDLPQAHSLALARQRRENPEAEGDAIDSLELKQDPLDMLALAAGFADGERWWEHVVEQQTGDMDVFTAIFEAMSTVREEMTKDAGVSYREQLREATMRKAIRQARKEYPKVAVVCGAWHLSALVANVKVKDDNALLKGLPKLKLQSTWIPWSYGRISYKSGYGAGVTAPGWYHHLWQYFQTNDDRRQQIAASWLTGAARLLRSQGFDVAPASVIDAVRLAESLAALRGSPKPGLDDMNEAIQALFCFGDATPMTLLNEKLMVSERIGTVPPDLPKAPLSQDLDKQVKTLRIKRTAVEQQLVLDLRKENGQQRSALFNRLALLGIQWADCQSSGQGKGTFKEIWQLQWQVEFELDLIEKSAWGNTIASAAAGYAIDGVKRSEHLAEICEWLNKLLLCNLPLAIPHAIQALEQRAAVVSDISELMGALPGLIKIFRYGDVRNTDTGQLGHVIDSFVTRICIGLAKACGQLDHDAAKQMATALDEVTESLNILQNPTYLDDWFGTLAKLGEMDGVQSVLAGRSFKLRLNADRIGGEDAAVAFAYALSRAQEPQHAADWIEGLLAGAGLLLVHDERIWSVLDNYLCGLADDVFENTLPLLRRTFAGFAMPERENLIRKANMTGSSQPVAAGPEPADPTFDSEKAQQVLPLLGKILGLHHE